MRKLISLLRTCFGFDVARDMSACGVCGVCCKVVRMLGVVRLRLEGWDGLP